MMRASPNWLMLVTIEAYQIISFSVVEYAANYGKNICTLPQNFVA
jgi:hypothetical protein